MPPRFVSRCATLYMSSVEYPVEKYVAIQLNSVPEVCAEGGRVQLQPEGGGEAVDGVAVAADGHGLVAAALPDKVDLLGVGVGLAGQEDEVVVLALGHSAVGLVCNYIKYIIGHHIML